MALSRIVFVAQLVAFAVAGPVDRNLAIEGASCTEVITDIRVPRYNICNCSNAVGNGGGNLNATCTGCPRVCAFGSCGAGQITRNLEFESDGSVVGQHNECFEYQETADGMGVSGLVCKTRNADATECSISVNGTSCSSCEMKTCPGDMEKQEYLADCSNLPGGQLFDFCEPITVADSTSAFIWFDSQFEVDITQCQGSGSTRFSFGVLATFSVVSSLVTHLSF